MRRLCASISLALLLSGCPARRSPVGAEPSGLPSSAPPASSAALDAGTLDAGPDGGDAGATASADLPIFVTWAREGAHVAVADHAWVTLTDVRDPAKTARLGPHPKRVTAVTWSDDAKQVVTAADDGALRLWSADGGPPRATWQAHVNELPSACFSHGGSLFAASFSLANQDAFVAVWSTATGDSVSSTKLEDSSSPYWQLAFRADDRTLVGFDATTVVMQDPATGATRKRRSFNTGATSPVALSPDGAAAATAEEMHALVVWRVDEEKQKTLVTVSDCQSHMTGVHFSPDARFLLVHSQAGWWRSFNVPSFSPRSTWRPKTPEEGADATMSDDGTTVLRVAPDRTIEIVDADTGKELRALEGKMPEGETPRFSTDHHHVAVGGPDPAVWDIQTGRRTPLPR